MGGTGRREGRLCTRGNTNHKVVSDLNWDVGTVGKHTWLVQTLLNVTKAKVCANIVEGRSFFARRSGRAKAERNS